MTATDELRRMLDERGVKHEGSERSVRWRDRNGVIMQAFPLTSGELGLEVWSCTPEQAIAATLGDADATPTRQGVGTCHDRGNIERFICSECGCRLDLQDDDWEATMWLDDGTAMVPRFCPNCGRRVVE